MKHRKYTTALIFFGMTAALGIHQAACADDGWVIEVTKQGITNPHQVAITPFVGNHSISELTLDALNQTDLKSSNQNLPSTPATASAVLDNIYVWRNTGYRYVVVGDSHAILGNKIATNVHIIDLAVAKPLGERFTHISGDDPEQIKAAANAIGAKIYAMITGASFDMTGKIAYVEEMGDARYKTSALKVMDVATQSSRTIDTVQGAILTPAFSPDGRSLAYTVLTNNALPVIYQYQLDGGQKTLLTPFKGSNLSPAFSADGNTLLFSGSHENDNPNIYALDLTANRLHAITIQQGAENSPSYLPNGQIIFTADNGSRSQSIYRMSAGGKPVRIASGSSPKVSKDGKKLAYTQGGSLMVANIDGSQALSVASIGTEGMASFSPTGTSIVYASQGGELIIRSLSGQQIMRLSTQGKAKDPVWSVR